MASNAIMVRRQQNGTDGGSAIDLSFLENYAATLNRMSFTIAQGNVWFVNKREMPDGSIQRYLDCRKAFEDEPRRSPPRTPSLRAPAERHPGHAE